MYKVKTITLREKAAVIYQLISGITDNITFYTIARGKEININRESYSNMGNILKNKEHIKQYYQEAQNIIDNYISARLKTLNIDNNDILPTEDNEINGVNGFSLKNIDFTNPSEFINYLNNQANTIQDEKTRREYLKMLAELLRFKDGASAGETDTQRFYTPQTCQNCMLYNLQKDEISAKG